MVLLGCQFVAAVGDRRLVGGGRAPKPTYVHQVQELVKGVRGEGTLSENESDEPFSLAALLMPARVADVEAISSNRERIPAKSTCF